MGFLIKYLITQLYKKNIIINKPDLWSIIKINFLYSIKYKDEPTNINGNSKYKDGI